MKKKTKAKAKAKKAKGGDKALKKPKSAAAPSAVATVATVVKVVTAPAKMKGIPARTARSASVKKLKWVLKPTRKPGACIKLGCTKTGCKGIFCKKHGKQLRKVQLALNNIPWRAKVKKMGKKYAPTQMHVAYRGKAVAATLKDEKRARALVKAEGSTYTMKMLDKALAEARKEMKQTPPPPPKAAKATEISASSPKLAPKLKVKKEVRRKEVAAMELTEAELEALNG